MKNSKIRLLNSHCSFPSRDNNFKSIALLRQLGSHTQKEVVCMAAPRETLVCLGVGKVSCVKEPGVQSVISWFNYIKQFSLNVKSLFIKEDSGEGDQLYLKAFLEVMNYFDPLQLEFGLVHGIKTGLIVLVYELFSGYVQRENIPLGSLGSSWSIKRDSFWIAWEVCERRAVLYSVSTFPLNAGKKHAWGNKG